MPPDFSLPEVCILLLKARRHALPGVYYLPLLLPLYATFCYYILTFYPYFPHHLTLPSYPLSPNLPSNHFILHALFLHTHTHARGRLGRKAPTISPLYLYTPAGDGFPFSTPTNCLFLIPLCCYGDYLLTDVFFFCNFYKILPVLLTDGQDGRRVWTVTCRYLMFN